MPRAPKDRLESSSTWVHPWTGPARLGSLLLVILGAASCLSSGPPRPSPVPQAASARLADARAAQRTGGPGAAVAMRQAAEEARALAPDWVAPVRFLDELEREELRAHGLLTERTVGLEQCQDARTLYLVGRLLGEAGEPLLVEASRLDPSFAWAHHGLAWNAFRAGRPGAALRGGRRALATARDPWERAYFASVQARYLLGLERHAEAERLLSEVLREGELAPGDRAELHGWLVRVQLASDDPGRIERGVRGALVLFEGGLLEPRARLEIGGVLTRVVAQGDPSWRTSFAASLGRAGDRESDALHARLELAGGDPRLALALWRRAGEPSLGDLDVDLRAARFAAGEGEDAIADWLAELPGFVLDAQGLPKEPALATLVRAAREGEEPGEFDLGEALLQAGWFREARGLAAHLAPTDPARALALETEGAAGVALLEGVHDLFDRIDRGEATILGVAQSVGTGARPVDDLGRLLGALEDLAVAHHPGRTADLVDSPRLGVPPIATLVHPGPRFSSEDGRAGRGSAGLAVPGLARWTAGLGRFGIFGESLGGGGPDGTLLRRLFVEERAGEHLGVAWQGTLAWCDGTDVPSRPMRQGARITGAALHEGYWVDVVGVRHELEDWRRLEARRDADPQGVSGLLQESGPRLFAGGRPASLIAPLGEAQRVRLALLCDRQAMGGGPMTLEELLAVVAVHEQGHLTERARFLPLGPNLLRVLGFLASSGFSPTRLSQRLEYRAQLIALAEVEDPRIPLAECLSGVEEGSLATPHAAGYRLLIEDFLRLLEERVLAAPDHLGLDPQRYLVHQLHRLDKEEVRRTALLLAAREGLFD